MTVEKRSVHPTVLLLTLFAAEVLSAFELSMLYPALKPMIAEFGNAQAAGWVMTSFFIASAVFAALCGRLGDLLGRKRLLQVVIILSIVGSLISGLSSSLAGLLVGRIIQGSSGAIFPLCLGLVRENVKPESVPMMIGILAATLTVTMGLGIFVGGIIVDTIGWRWIFWGGALAGLIALAAVTWQLPTNVRPSAQALSGINLTGGILFAPALVILLLLIQKGAAWGWASPMALGSAVVSLALFSIWAWSEIRAKKPLLDVRLLVDRQVLLVNLGSVMLGVSSFQSLQIWSIILQQPTTTGVGLGVSASVSGLALLPKTLVALIAGPAAGWLIARYSGRFALIFGSSIMLAMWTALMFNHSSVLGIALLLTLLGFGMSTYYASIPILITRSVPMEKTSEAGGMMIVIRATAMGIGAHLVAMIFNSSTIAVGGVQYPDETALMRVLLYVMAGCVAQICIALFLKPVRVAVAGESHGH